MRPKAADPALNEDQLFASETVLALADGATDKTGLSYPNGKSGGRNLAEIAVAVSARSPRTGYELADEITRSIQDFYQQHNAEAVTDTSKRAATTLVVARIVGQAVVVTQIGDTTVRVRKTDGSEIILTNDKRIDAENAITRAQTITHDLAAFQARMSRQPSPEERAVIVAHGRSAILSRLEQQHLLQNSTTDHVYGYGMLDGSPIPRTYQNGRATNYVRRFRFALRNVATIELISDGLYGAFPDAPSKAAYQQLYHHIHQTDPDKYLDYPSTKPIDDASVIIATIS